MDTVFLTLTVGGVKRVLKRIFFFWFLQCFHNILPEVRAQAEKQIRNLIHVLLILKNALILTVRI